MTEPGFVHLRVRSAFSLLESAVTHKGLAQACLARGMPAVAVTDRANLFGVMPFCAAAMAAGVQPIVGALVPLAIEIAGPGHRRPQRPPSMVLLVQNETGYGNLLRLLSRAYLATEPGAEIALAPDELIAANEGLIALTGGAGGPLARLALAGETEAAGRLCAVLHRAFGDRLYIEIGRHDEEAENRSEPFLLDLAYARNIPLVATNDVHFLEPSMHEAHDALICLAEGSQVAVDDRRRVGLDYRFKTAEEMTRLFADLPEAIENTLAIARRCAFAAPARDPILPPFDTGAGRDENEELRVQAEAGLERRIERGVHGPVEAYRERLAFELDVIVQMKFPGYFLIVSDFIRWAKGEGIPVGPGRGSGAGSVVAWALEITDLDPLRFGLLFERFLNPEQRVAAGWGGRQIVGAPLLRLRHA
ncbi:MAG: PHP domain-containing protein, partial [Geminicoccaceae bacterium]|nr:PHP domain-containing protein [Geminicoccaceae bacterium]